MCALIQFIIFALIIVPMITPSVLTGLFPILLESPLNVVTTPISSFLGAKEVSVLTHIGPPESPTAPPDKYNWFVMLIYQSRRLLLCPNQIRLYIFESQFTKITVSSCSSWVLLFIMMIYKTLLFIQIELISICFR